MNNPNTEIIIETLESVKTNHINYVLMMCGYNRVLAAEKLGIAPKTLQNFIISNPETNNKSKTRKMIEKLHQKGFKPANERLSNEMDIIFREDDFKITGYRDPTPEERDHWYNMNYCN